MRKSSMLPHILIGALFSLASAYSVAQTYKYRIPNKAPQGAASGTGGAVTPPTGTGTGGTGTGGTGGTGSGGTTTPPPTYATNGVRWSVNGTPSFQASLGPGEQLSITLRNTSTNTLQGWLTTSVGGYARAEMAGSTCTQNTAGTVPTTLAPGATCTFALIGTATEFARPADYFWFKAMDGQVIPDSLYLPEIEYVSNPPPGGNEEF